MLKLKNNESIKVEKIDNGYILTRCSYKGSEEMKTKTFYEENPLDMIEDEMEWEKETMAIPIKKK